MKPQLTGQEHLPGMSFGFGISLGCRVIELGFT